MKKIILRKSRFSNCISAMLVACISLNAYGQNHTTANDIRNNINIIENKSSEAAIYAEKATNAAIFSEVKTNAKQAANLLSEAQKAVSDAVKIHASVAIPDNNLKYETAIRNISHQIEDLQNKVNWAHLKSVEATDSHELDEAKYVINKSLKEITRIKNVIAEIKEELTKAEQILTRMD